LRIVLDTNVVVSAALESQTASRVLLHITADPTCFWLVTREILDEYFEVLGRPRLAILPAAISSFEAKIRRSLLHVMPDALTKAPIRDPEDIKWLECAIAGNADYLITGDKDFDSLRGLTRFSIVTPAEFLEVVESPEST